MEVITDNKPAMTAKNFESGHLYRHTSSHRKSDIWLYFNGFLIDVVVGKTGHNVDQQDIKAADYLDVTDQFALVEKCILEDSKL